MEYDERKLRNYPYVCQGTNRFIVYEDNWHGGANDAPECVLRVGGRTPHQVKYLQVTKTNDVHFRRLDISSLKENYLHIDLDVNYS